jgi:hypothetical protein
MHARFTSREDGPVDFALDAEWSLLEEALNDSVSSLPPRGAPGNGPSTYWADVALAGLELSLATCSGRPFTAGNFTLLRLNGGRVEARHEYDAGDVPGQFLDVGDFRQLLNDWRVRTQAKASASTAPLPQTYRRNPHT